MTSELVDRPRGGGADLADTEAAAPLEPVNASERVRAVLIVSIQQALS